MDPERDHHELIDGLALSASGTLGGSSPNRQGRGSANHDSGEGEAKT